MKTWLIVQSIRGNLICTLLLADYDMTNLLHTYQKLYKCIMACNLVIDGLTDADGTEDEKMQTRGEALALRAYYYFLLVNLYAMPYNCAGTNPESLWECL